MKKNKSITLKSNLYISLRYHGYKEIEENNIVANNLGFGRIKSFKKNIDYLEKVLISIQNKFNQIKMHFKRLQFFYI